MKRSIIISVAVLLLPLCAAAQLDTQVEVTKAYVPSLESASKLNIEPDITDTVMMRPEIDYTITPLSLTTSLSTRPIRPATVTYWEFNRPLPCYVRLGAGYTPNSAADIYLSTQNPSTGYLIGAVNHTGSYADLCNAEGVKHRAWRMENRATVAAGKYLGRHILEGAISYDHRIIHRYGLTDNAAAMLSDRPGSRAVYGDAAVDLRVGDEFQDMSRPNFEVAFHGNLFSGDMGNIANTRGRQLDLGGSAKFGYRIGNHSFFTIAAEYTHMKGYSAMEEISQNRLLASLRFGRNKASAVRFDAGVDYWHDKVSEGRAGDFIAPYLRLNFDMGRRGLMPFLEIDGRLYDNSFRSLACINPYMADAAWMERSSMVYDGRLGIGGAAGNDRFSYRLFAAFTIRDNHLYWFSLADFTASADPEEAVAGSIACRMARQSETSLNIRMDYRPVSELHFSIGAKGSLYNDESKVRFDGSNRVKLHNGMPAFQADAAIRYEGRKISAGIAAQFASERTWSAINISTDGAGAPHCSNYGFEAPFAIDLGLDFEWRISRSVAVFAEAHNLLNRKLYPYMWYRGDGANFTAGVKLNF